MDSPVSKAQGSFQVKTSKLDKIIRDQSKLMVERCQALYEYECLYETDVDKSLYTDERVDLYCQIKPACNKQAG